MRHFFVTMIFFSFLVSAPAKAQDYPVVVELFTSQGCSSCPPADDILRHLATKDHVIALALHVDYWDYIGWVDVFGRPEHTARQQAYARAADAPAIFTPQMVVNGRDLLVGSRSMQVLDAVQAHARQPNSFAVSLVRNGDLVVIRAEPGLPGNYDVQLVRYVPLQSVEIRRGENAGHAFDYTNVVTSWDLVGQWNGIQPLNLPVPAAGADPVVAIIQTAGHGPIMGAAQLR